MKEQFIRDGDKVTPIKSAKSKRLEMLKAKYAKIAERYKGLRVQNPNIPKMQLCDYICMEFGYNAYTIYRIIHNYGY